MPFLIDHQCLALPYPGFSSFLSSAVMLILPALLLLACTFPVFCPPIREFVFQGTSPSSPAFCIDHILLALPGRVVWHLFGIPEIKSRMLYTYVSIHQTKITMNTRKIFRIHHCSPRTNVWGYSTPHPNKRRKPTPNPPSFNYQLSRYQPPGSPLTPRSPEANAPQNPESPTGSSEANSPERRSENRPTDLSDRRAEPPQLIRYITRLSKTFCKLDESNSALQYQ